MKIVYILSMLIAFLYGLLNPLEYNLSPVMSEIKQKYLETQAKIRAQIEQDKYNKYSHWEKIIATSKKVAKEEEYPLSVLLAQAALESGHGTSYLCRTRNNCFGIGAVDWNPDLAYSYPTLEEGIRAYTRLIKKHYKSAYTLKDNPVAMVTEIKRLGYATDPLYISKVTNMKVFKDYVTTNL